jgi:transposase
MARVSSTAPTPPLTTTFLETLLARITALEVRGQAREERIGLPEEENFWLKAQLLGRSTETAGDELNPEQAWLFNEAQALAKAAESAPISVTIPAQERGRRDRKKLSTELPRMDVVHDLPADEKICATDGTERIGEECHRAAGPQARRGAGDP